jgi:hypothetical protein
MKPHFGSFDRLSRTGKTQNFAPAVLRAAVAFSVKARTSFSSDYFLQMQNPGLILLTLKTFNRRRFPK